MNKLWILGLALALGACAAPIQHQTASGRPEVLIHNTAPDSAKAAIVNGMMSRQYRISRDTPYEIAFDKPVDEGMDPIKSGRSWLAFPTPRLHPLHTLHTLHSF